ncbi:hypothetical protein H4217_002395 [Coemansia sp. RSA 1939]|nr:hypothetical protein H4217_002395 [Coemansia sp. RSA 1939]KAJ2614609.1 hypothetical protein EV177_001966 [Coemansia sp. RSA 1804]
MAGNSWGVVARRVVKALYLVGMLVTMAGLALMYVWAYKYLEAAPPTLNRVNPPPDAKDPTLYRMSWQGDDTEYEAKVYASPIKTLTKANADKFFETAQELWHLEPHTLENRYPSYKTSVKVSVAAKSLEKRTDALYAHIFVQRRGQFAPHPNVSDPFAVHKYAELAKWRPIHPEPVRTAFPFIKFESDVAVDYELVATAGVSWAMVLENHAFTKKELPFGIVVPNSPTVDSRGRATYTYNPPLLQDIFVKNEWPTHGLLASSDAAQTIDVALELDGIKLRWIKPKMVAMLMMPAANNLTMTPIKVPVPDPKSPGGTRLVLFKPALYIGDEPLVDFVYSRGIRTFLCAALVLIAMYCVYLVVMFLGMCFFLGPRDKWAGFSRTSFAIVLATYAIGMLVLAPSIGLGSAILSPYNAAVLVVALAMYGVPLDPRRWREHWESRRLLDRQQHQDRPGYQLLEDTELDETPASAASSEESVDGRRGRRRSSAGSISSGIADIAAEGDGTLPAPAYSSAIKADDPHEHIRNIRRSVDRMAMRWLVLSVGPTLVVTSLLTIFSSKPMSLGSVLAFAIQLLIVLDAVYGSVWLVPQILVNRRARSGALFSPGFHLGKIVVGLLFVLFVSVLRVNGAVAGPMWLVYLVAWLCNVIAFAQWVAYRFFSG